MRRRTDLDEEDEEHTKRGRMDDSLSLVTVSETSTALTTIRTEEKVPRMTGRRSDLLAQNMCLTGHEGAVFAISFDSTGTNLCSASFDSKIYLWEVFGECKNYNLLAGHKNAVLDVKWFNNGSSHIVSASADKTVGLWDANKGVRLRKLTDHSAIVNCCAIAKSNITTFASGSDDCTAVSWDIRTRKPVQTLYHDYQVTSIAMSHSGQDLYTGGIDNVIRRFDLRMHETPTMSLEPEGHGDIVTGLALSPDGNFLLSNSMDSTLRCWDVRPFILEGSSRQVAGFDGVHHGAEKNLLKCAWSPDQEMISCGSADRVVHIWDASNARPLYLLGGHKGSVNDVIFHPTQPIVASCGSDKTIYLGELAVE